MRLKNLVNLTVLATATLAISGCSSLGFFNQPEEKVVIQTEYVEKNIPLRGAPKPMTLNDVKWHVVTAENFDEFIETYTKENGEPWVFYAISVRSYESMALNMAELRRYIEQQQAIIYYYEQAVQPSAVPQVEE